MAQFLFHELFEAIDWKICVIPPTELARISVFIEHLQVRVYVHVKTVLNAKFRLRS
jgi:hypothetical protein